MIGTGSLLIAQDASLPSRGASVVATKVSPFVATVSAQAAAITKHPELGKAGSASNREFLARFKRCQKEMPAFFENAEWPIKLADEVADSGIPAVVTRRLATQRETATAPASDDRIQLQGRTATSL